MGQDLAAFGSQCMFCGDRIQLRPYSAITLLATLTENHKVTSEQIAWPQKEHFANVDVDIDQGPPMQYGVSQLFATSGVLQFVLYRTRCTPCVLTQQFGMDLPLAKLVRALLTGGAFGYPPSSLALPAPVLEGQHIRIVSTNYPEWKRELTGYGIRGIFGTSVEHLTPSVECLTPSVEYLAPP